MPVLADTRIVQVATVRNPFRFTTDDADLGQVHRVHLKSVVIPNTEYNVNNKTSSVSVTAADMIAVADLPLGQYNISTFLSALKAVLDTAAAPNTFSITADPLTRKLVFVKSGGAEFTVERESQVSRLIGQVSARTSTGLTLTTESIPDLSGMRLCVFNSFTLGKWKISSGDTASEKRKTNALGSLPMTAGFGELLKAELTEEGLNTHAFPGYQNISNFEISLVDEDSELLELNGAEYVITLEAHIRGAT